MKVKTVRKFKDLKARKMRSVGEVFEVTKERFEGINSTAHGVLVEAVNRDGDWEDYAEKYPLTEEWLSSMTKKEIIKHAGEKGIKLDMKMTKQEMIKELI